MKILKGWIKQITLPLLVLVLAVSLINGCRTYKPGYVYKEWTRTMSQEGIFPVFPPREDVQVGDVWLLPTHPYKTGAIEAVGGLGRTGIWVDNILSHGTSTTSGTPITSISDVNKFYDDRSSFPSSALASASIIGSMQVSTTTASTDKKVNSDGIKIITVPRGTDTAGIFTEGDNNRLRQVAFPEFSVTNITQASASALVPIEYFSAALGFSSNRVREVSLKIPSAESYGFPAYFITKDLFRSGSLEWHGDKLLLSQWDYKNEESLGIRGLNKATVKLARMQFDEAFTQLAHDKRVSFSDRNKIRDALDEHKDYIYVSLINEVFYARAIDINIRTRKARGGAAFVKPITSEMLSQLDRLESLRSGTETTTTEIVETDASGGTTTTNIKVERKDDAFDLAEKMNTYNENLANQSVIGGTVKFVSASDAGVGLRRIFDRPIAVGVRGVILKLGVDTFTCKDKDCTGKEYFEVVTIADYANTTKH